MNFEELLSYLELESPEEFEYFESLADLIETEEEIMPEAIYKLFEGIDMEIFGELVSDYFEEMLKAVPEDAVELYTLLDSVKMALMGMSKHLEEENEMVLMADEFFRFRNWYSLDSVVWVQALSNLQEPEKSMPLRDALTLSRIEKLGGETYEYSFEDVLDFEMDQYTMTFADLMQDQAESRLDRDPELDDFSEPGIEYTDQIFTPEESTDKYH